MPVYTFRHRETHVLREEHCTIADLPKVTAMMEQEGYDRLFDTPAIQIVPGYREAYEESEGILRDRHRQKRKRQEEAAALIRQGLHEEGYT